MFILWAFGWIDAIIIILGGCYPVTWWRHDPIKHVSNCLHLEAKCNSRMLVFLCRAYRIIHILDLYRPIPKLTTALIKRQKLIASAQTDVENLWTWKAENLGSLQDMFRREKHNRPNKQFQWVFIRWSSGCSVNIWTLCKPKNLSLVSKAPDQNIAFLPKRQIDSMLTFHGINYAGRKVADLAEMALRDRWRTPTLMLQTRNQSWRNV